MGWFENFTLVMRSNIASFRERIENPERMLHQLLVDMEEELERVRDGVAEAIADEIQMGKRVDAARKEAREWADRAAQALTRGDETSSRSALEQKILAEKRAEAIDQEYHKQSEETRRLQRSVRD
ncbi:MAG: PspA/IM30 family protein, partial [Thermoanaerobaculia bacterium]